MDNNFIKRDTKRMSLRGYRNTTAKRAGSNRVTISVSPEDAAVRGDMTVGLTRREAEVLKSFLNEYFQG